MKTPRPHLALAAVLLTALLPACGGRLETRLFLPNRPPAVRLTSDPASEPAPDFHSWHLHWIGDDPDGRVVRYLVAVDPPAVDRVDSTWKVTTATDRVLTFRDALPAELSSPPVTVRHPHVFAVRAVDDRGAMSAPATRAFFLDNVAPEVRITEPYPSSFYAPPIGENCLIQWVGSDPDVAGSKKPVKYKYKLLMEGNPEFDVNLAIMNPDSLRRRYAPTFAGWDSLPGDSAFKRYRGLVPGHRYLFAVTAFDSVGDYDPVFSLDKNLLQFQASYWSPPPTLTVRYESFSYSFLGWGYWGGGYGDPPSRTVKIEVPAGAPLTFGWSAQRPQAAEMSCYRWVVDPANLEDDTPRSDEWADLRHWSQCYLDNTSCTLGPFTGAPPEIPTHKLYIEASATSGSRCLGIIQFTVVRPTFQKGLLIVNDARLAPDLAITVPDPLHPDSLQPPSGSWPTRAELDTFLFAVGGVRWRMAPDGTASFPGLLAGYDFDTLSTYRDSRPDGVTFEELSRYRQVIWISEWNGVDRPWHLEPNALSRMTDSGRQNVLLEYARAGGRVWLLGGAGGLSSTRAWDQRENNNPSRGWTVFSDSAVSGAPAELQAGRLMFDAARWRTGFVHSYGVVAPDIVRSQRAVGGWAGAPDYSRLPAGIRAASSFTEPAWPYRANCFDDGACRADTPVEWLNRPNEALEGFGVPPASVLDTLYEARAGSWFPPPPAVNACMTYYHGADVAPFVFTGFDLWSRRRADLIGLLDFVLQELWKLPRRPVDRTGALPSAAARR